MSGGGGTQTTQQQYSPEEQEFRRQVMSAARRLYQSNAGNQFTGPAPVGASAETLAAQQGLTNFASGAGKDLAGQVGAATKFGLNDVLYPGSNPALQATIDTATRNINEQYTDPNGVLANIRQHFTGGTTGTSSREGIAGGIAARSYLNTLGDVTGRITSDAYNKGLDTFSRTLAFSPNAYNLMLQPSLTMGAVGQQKEIYDQAGVDYEAARRTFHANKRFNRLQNYANIIYGGGSSQNTVNAQTETGPAQRAGMALAGASIGGMAAQGTAIAPGYGTAAGAALGLLLSYF